jgi:hypothetical protein
MKHLILILTILSSSLIVGCGAEGEFDFAITKGSEHGQTKDVPLIDGIPADQITESSEETQILQDEEELGLGQEAFGLTEFNGTYENEYPFNNSVNIVILNNEITVTNFIGIEGQVDIIWTHSFDSTQWTKEEVSLDGDIQTHYVFYDANCNCELGLVESDEMIMTFSDHRSNEHYRLTK